MRIAWMYYVEGLTQNEIADRLGLEGASVVRLVDRLEREGYVERRAASDRRVKTIHTTPKGEALAAECPALVPSFKNDVKPVLDARCNNCHVPGLVGAPWPFDSYQDTVDWKTLVLQDLHDCSMPPADAGAPLSEAERNTLNAWIVCGTPLT